jgi:BlaI family transcriptional regulator, penicillinase repressor
MPRGASEPLTPAEWKVMKVVWRRKKCAARDVYEETLREYAWAPSTAKSVLRRLVDKGYLTTTQVGNCYVYRPASAALQALLGVADALLETVLDGTTGVVLTHLVKNSSLSADELANLRALIDAQTPKEE